MHRCQSEKAFAPFAPAPDYRERREESSIYYIQNYLTNLMDVLRGFSVHGGNQNFARYKVGLCSEESPGFLRGNLQFAKRP